MLQKSQFMEIEGGKVPDNKIAEKTIKNIKRLMKVINEVEDTAIQVKLGLISYKEMEQENDYFYANKLERFKHRKRLVKIFLSHVLEPEDLYEEPEDSNVEIIEQIFRFKRRFFLN